VSEKPPDPVKELLRIVASVLEEAKECSRLVREQAGRIERQGSRIQEMESVSGRQSKQIGILMDEIYRMTQEGLQFQTGSVPVISGK